MTRLDISSVAKASLTAVPCMWKHIHISKTNTNIFKRFCHYSWKYHKKLCLKDVETWKGNTSTRGQHQLRTCSEEPLISIITRIWNVSLAGYEPHLLSPFYSHHHNHPRPHFRPPPHLQHERGHRQIKQSEETFAQSESQASSRLIAFKQGFFYGLCRLHFTTQIRF